MEREKKKERSLILASEEEREVKQKKGI